MRIETILEKKYNLTLTSIAPLEGYESINYKVLSKEGTFVLKQYDNKPKTIKEIIAEDDVVSHLQKLEPYHFPHRISTKEGNPYFRTNDHLYRLLTFIEGEFLGEVSHTPALLSSLGMFLGHIDNRLLQEDVEILKAKEIVWDLTHFRKNYQYRTSITDARDRNLVEYFFLQFEEHIRPIMYDLRQSLIHNDANDWNILTDGKKVTGIIDFGDMCHSWLIAEVAIAMTYVMMNKEEPLKFGIEVLKGYHKELPLTALECDCLYYLIAARLCISVCNSAYAKDQKSNSSYITISEKGAWDLLYKLISINPVKARNEFRTACSYPRSFPSVNTALLKNREKHFGKILSLSYTDPIHMEGAAFQYMYDAEGNTFLDAYNNIMLAGHCHPLVVKAGQQAMAQLNTNTRYLYDSLEEYSTALLEKFPPSLNKVIFVNSGSEASDLAIRMAKYHSRKKKIMVMEHGYHGHTNTGINISAYKYQATGGIGQQTDTIETPLPKVFGSKWTDDGSAGAEFSKRTIMQIAENNGDIAAFIAEPIVGCGGQVPLAKGYLKAVYPKIREQGGLCISDEVQVGFGRLGDVFWGYELYGVIPDIVIIGKPMGNGHPMGAVITTEEVMRSFEKGPEFFSSFGGNPVSCAIGLSVLHVIEEEGLMEHAKRTGNYLMDQLRNLQKTHSVIGDVRGHGLFLGMELNGLNGQPLTELAFLLINNLREHHILVSTDGPHENVIKIKPPLSFNKDNCDELVSKIGTILTENVDFL
ncbi:aminotransferase class III-fold pyridoxal phosphate-dependent enzyme [uncultured Muriicola sp.]|uniref:aminotransferase class III-fold pyridoxal phosphate-dependent enzyme n=1 Tax=uncultured Muriicola sp. TaxID=1583102 RepID=UPI00262D2DA7|nr:aminotransferase class III-fold pyridoxal phosphate-dependent enzyme [uncultured Muriicola sp.]